VPPVSVAMDGIQRAVMSLASLFLTHDANFDVVAELT
jgi:hypothetical protein